MDLSFLLLGKQLEVGAPRLCSTRQRASTLAQGHAEVVLLLVSGQGHGLQGHTASLQSWSRAHVFPRSRVRTNILPVSTLAEHIFPSPCTKPGSKHHTGFTLSCRPSSREAEDTESSWGLGASCLPCSLIHGFGHSPVGVVTLALTHRSLGEPQGTVWALCACLECMNPRLTAPFPVLPEETSGTCKQSLSHN